MMIRRPAWVLLPAFKTLAFLAICAVPAAADPPGRIPRAVRDMSTDRPDKTESPYTVPAGRFQLEADLLSFRHHSSGDLRTIAWDVAPFNLKIGLADNVDLQLVLGTFYTEHTEHRTLRIAERHSGLGDLTARLKLNVLGNDAGPWALAVMPFVKLPTDRGGAGNDAVEGGLIVPFATELPRGWSLGLMTELDVLRNDRYYASFINSITVGHDLTQKLAGYVEFYSEVSRQRGEGWIGSIDVGLTYGLTPNLQLDAGINRGVTGAADDINPFMGVSWRFGRGTADRRTQPATHFDAARVPATRLCPPKMDLRSTNTDSTGRTK
jgi:hypothetical protein